MASYSTGVSANFGGTTFQEITGLSWSYGGGPSKGRSVVWTDEAGSVSLICLGTAGIATSKYGDRDTLTISGGGSNLTCKAIYEGLNVAYEVNGVTRFTVTFKLLDG